MKILVTGSKGMLARTLFARLAGHELIGADLPEWDITDAGKFTEKTLREKPDLVIHTAAMTNVDACESEREAAFKVNAEGSGNVAAACKAAGARLIAVSTDYVFSGEGDPGREWSETDTTGAASVYGASKALGEELILQRLPDAVVLRISWLYGAGGPSFVHTMARLGAEAGAPLKVVDDQRGNPTSAETVAGVIRFLIDHPEVSGIVHGTCEGVATWYEFACEIKRLVNALQPSAPGFVREIVPCSTLEFPRPAPRPKVSSLKKGVLNLLGYRTEDWRIALSGFVRKEFSADMRQTSAHSG